MAAFHAGAANTSTLRTPSFSTIQSARHDEHDARLGPVQMQRLEDPPSGGETQKELCYETGRVARLCVLLVA